VGCARPGRSSRRVPEPQGHQRPCHSAIGLAGGVRLLLLGDELFASSCSTRPAPAAAAPNRCSPLLLPRSSKASARPGRPQASSPRPARDPQQVGADQGRGWGPGGRPQPRSPLPEQIHCGKRAVMAPRSAWARPLSLSRPGPSAFAGAGVIRRVLLQVQHSPAAADQDLQRSRPLSPQASATAHQAARLERTTATAPERICDLRWRQKFRHWRNADPGPRGAAGR